MNENTMKKTYYKSELLKMLDERAKMSTMSPGSKFMQRSDYSGSIYGDNVEPSTSNPFIEKSGIVIHKK